MEIEVLVAAIDGLVAAGPAVFADGESVEVLHRQLDRLEAVVTAATGAFDAAGGFEADGAQTAAAWVATRTGQPKGAVRRRVALARRLSDLPVCEAAWLDGEIGAAHVAAIAAAGGEVTGDALARDEKLLVDNAKTLRFEAFARSLAYWSQLADPDGAEEAEQCRRDRRDVYLAQSFGGMWLGQMTLDPISGAIVAGELERIEAELFEADWAQARLRLDAEPTLADLARSPAQRRADAIVEMATRSATAPADGRRPAPLVTFLIGYETAHGRISELANGTVIAPGAVLGWLDQAYIERAVFSLPNRVEVSAAARLFTGATRRALELRDRQCTHPYCDQPSERCQCDHIVPHAQGGPTTQENGRLLCGFHNRLNQSPPRPPPEPDP